MPEGANRLTATANVATLSEPAGTKLRNSRRRIAPFRDSARSERQLEYVIEVSFPQVMKDSRIPHTASCADPIDKTEISTFRRGGYQQSLSAVLQQH